MALDVHMSAFTILDYEHTGDGDHEHPHAPHIIMAYIFPILAGLAVFGNSLYVISIAFTDLKNKTTGILLMSSNISSIILTLASLCIVYFPWLFEAYPTGSKSPCNILIFVYHALASWSTYLLASACIERYIAICHPMSKYSIRSQAVIKQSVKLMIGTFVVSIIINCPMIWFSELRIIVEMPEYGNLTFCYYSKENWYMSIHEYVDLTLYSVIPFIIICFCNVAIIRKIYFHKTLLQSFRSSNDKNSAGNMTKLPHRSQAVKLTIMLLPASLLHLLFSLIVVISILVEETIAKTPHEKLLSVTVSYNAMQLQAGYYFYANIVLSSVFRRIFVKMFKCEHSSIFDFKSSLDTTSTTESQL